MRIASCIAKSIIEIDGQYLIADGSPLNEMPPGFMGTFMILLRTFVKNFID